MPDLIYAMVGAGRWGKRLAGILSDNGRQVVPVALSRKASNESEPNYRGKVIASFQKMENRVNAVWLAVPPGDQFTLVDAALDQGWHVVVEKPWKVSIEKTLMLQDKAKQNSLHIGVHHQYCYLEALPDMSKVITGENSPTTFSANFITSRENRLKLDPLRNLASHLLAIHALFFPKTQITYINAAYNDEDRRDISLQQGVDEFGLDFTANSEPLIQRFIDGFENAIEQNEPFHLNLELALSIEQKIKIFEKAGDW